MKWLDKLERKFGRFAIRGLMTYIVGLSGFAFLLIKLNPSFKYELTLNLSAVLRGEVWRLITYIFIPDTLDIFWIIFSLYLYYMIGNQLEHEWGSFKFNVYYLIGMLGTTIAVLLTGGSGTATYLNLSLFLAFAYLYPNYELLLFFILPIKVKYLAWLDLGYIALTVLSPGANLSVKAAALVSILNYFVFFGKDMLTNSKNRKYAYKNRQRYREQIPKTKDFGYTHKCSVCGLTDRDDPAMDFRYCPECDGRHAYCKEHIYNHEHIKVEKVIQFPDNKK